MKTIIIGQRTSFEIRNANVSGFIVKINGIGSAVDTTPVDVPYKARISAKLRQAGFNETILDGTITGLAKGTSPRLESWVESDTQSTRVITAAAGEVVGVSEWVYKIQPMIQAWEMFLLQDLLLCHPELFH